MIYKCDKMANYRTNQKSLIISSNTKRKRLSTSSVVILASVIYISLIIPSVYGGDCPVLEERCDFSYIWEDPDGNQPDVAVTACRDDNNFEGSGNMEMTTEIRSEYVCPLNVALFDEQKTWGICNEECLEENGEPKDFKDDPVMQLLHSCRIKPAICKFPFTYKAESHSSCLQRGDIQWCATKVDENNEPVPGYWGKCNVDEGTTDCDPSWTAPEPEPETVKDYKPMVAVVEINADDFESNVSASIKIEEDSPQGVMKITGWVKGLKAGLHGFHIHKESISPDSLNCTAAGEHFNPTNQGHMSFGDSINSHIGDLGNIEADDNGLATVNITLDRDPRPTLYDEGNTFILGRTLVINEESSFSDSDKRIACGIITKPVDEGIAIHILIIILVVVIIFVIAILICIICYCTRGRNPKKGKQPQTNGVQDPVDMNGYKPKKPLFDELSIPFIDASPANSPKPGRSTDRLSFFNRSTSAIGSRGSLSNEDKC